MPWRLSKLYPGKLAKKVFAYVKFGVPLPLLRAYWCKILPCDDGGVQEGFQWVIKNKIHFVLRRNESIENGGIREECNCGSDNQVHYSHERRKRNDRAEMRRGGVKGNFLESLPVLYP